MQYQDEVSATDLIKLLCTFIYVGVKNEYFSKSLSIKRWIWYKREEEEEKVNSIL